MSEHPRMLLVERDRAVCVGGRWDGWLFWMHPNGHWVSARKLLEAEPTVDPLFSRPASTEPLGALLAENDDRPIRILPDGSIEEIER
jgi:hypothetical protein